MKIALGHFSYINYWETIQNVLLDVVARAFLKCIVASNLLTNKFKLGMLIRHTNYQYLAPICLLFVLFP